MNVIAVTGRNTGQPELKMVGEKQTPKVSFRVAINNGDDQKSTFVNVETWTKTAEAVAQYKNQVDGTLRSSEWTKQAGTKLATRFAPFEQRRTRKDGTL